MNASIADRRRKANPARRPKLGRTHVAIGIDVADRFSEICEFDEQGAVAIQTRLRTTQVALQEHFGSHAPARVALETGMHSGWISRLIAACGHEAIVANARELRKIYQSDRKNDRADAEIMCNHEILRSLTRGHEDGESY